MEGKELGPIEQSIVISALQGELKSSFQIEGLKGCDPTIYAEPVPIDIEAPFQPYQLKTFLKQPNNNVVLTPNKFVCQSEKVFLRLWFSTLDKFEWQQFETLIRELSIIKSPIDFLLVGNHQRITCQLGISRDEEMPVRHTISSKFPNIQIDTNTENCFSQLLQQHKNLSDKDYAFDFRDFYPMPPYWKNLSGFEGIKVSPLMPVFSALNELRKDEIGFYQIIFKSAANDNGWRENIINLVESEYASRYGNLNQNFSSHAGFGSDYYKEARKKLSGPFFSVSIRTGAFCRAQKIRGVLDSLSLAIAGFQYGNRNLRYLTSADYSRIFRQENLINAINLALVYRCGILLTSTELAALCHFPPSEALERNVYAIDKAVGFRATAEFLENEGVVLGESEFAGKKQVITQPERIRNLHTSLTGLIGKGKSVLIENMALDDIGKGNGNGVGLVDPHGDCLERILKQIPEHRVDDVIYFSPCEENFAVCYNPFALNPGEDVGKRVDDLIVSVRSLYSAKDWGHVIESTLIPVFYTLLRGENLALSDARVLLSKTSEGSRLRKSVIPIIDNQEVRMFWTDLFERIPTSTIQRVLTKLSKFLLQEKVGRIFSQKENKINFRKIIDEKKIFLCYLPAGIIGSDCANILGSTIVAAFHNAGMSRQDTPPSQRVPFNLYIDEFHRFPIKSFEDSLRELRKYNVRLILSYQQREQLTESLRLALGNAGTMIVLDLDWDDAQIVYKEFYSQVEAHDFMKKKVGEGYVKMGNEIVSFCTPKPRTINGEGFSRKIIRRSTEKYYTPIRRDRKNRTETQSKKREKRLREEKLYDEI